MLGINLGLYSVYTSAPENSEYYKTEISGIAGNFRLNIGRAITDSSVIYGSYSFLSAKDPDISSDGETLDLDEASYTISGLGIGTNYYIMPQNVYLGMVVDFPIHSIEIRAGGDSESDDSDVGVTFNGIAGIEGWASDEWGLGINAMIGFGSFKGESGRSFSSTTFGVNLTATYN